MAVTITPGPLNANDGDRIHVQRLLSQFVSGTRITNFGQEEIFGSQISIVTSATDPPSTSFRDRSTLWFARGEGVLYKWTLNPTGDTGGRWLAMSTRREQLALIKQPCNPYSLVWPGATASEFRISQGRFERMTIYYAATESSGGTRALMLGPYASAQTETTGDEFMPVVLMGYTNVQTANLADLSNFGKAIDDLADRVNLVSDPYGSSASQVGLGFLTQSGASGDTVQSCFLFCEPTGWIL